MRAEITRLAAAGLTGVEVDHPDHAPGDRDALRRLARELDLVITGSSDYHGAPQEAGPRRRDDRPGRSSTGCSPGVTGRGVVTDPA